MGVVTRSAAHALKGGQFLRFEPRNPLNGHSGDKQRKDRSWDDSRHKKVRWGTLLLLFLTAATLLWLGLSNFPGIREDGVLDPRLKIPKNFAELRDIDQLLQEHMRDHAGMVLFGYCCTYLFMQTFSVPGSTGLNFLSGALFGRWAGTFISLTTATLGAMCSYFVALFLLKGLITRLFPKRVRLVLPQQSWQALGLPKVLPPVFVMHLMPWFCCWYHFYTYSLLSFMDFVVLHGFRFGIGSRCNTYLSLSFGAQLCRLLQGTTCCSYA